MVIDKYAGQMRLTSPYSYAYNNPINLADENGKWPFYIHHRIIREAFKGILTQKQIDRLIKASNATDNDKGNQKPDKDYLHYMAQPGQTPEDAANEAEEFVKAQQNAYVIALTDSVALTELGKGMHTLMDKTSPAHVGKKGPKVWGKFSFLLLPYHILAESNLFHLSESRVQEAVTSLMEYYLQSSLKKYLTTIEVGPLTPEPPPPAPDPSQNSNPQPPPPQSDPQQVLPTDPPPVVLPINSENP
jgi:hypothetical protein